MPNRETDLRDAWIGDAVLTLYARLHILSEDNRVDGAKSVRMTSNQFLSAVGEPTQVEAAIGREYAASGLDGAFRWIEARLIPMFRRQEEKRFRKSGV